MLVLTRKPGESINIGNDIVVTVEEIRGGKARVSIDAPKEIRIMRSELQDANRSDVRPAGRAGV